MVDLLLQALVIFIVTIDPIGLGPIYAGLSHGYLESQRRSMAIRGILIATAVLLLFALAGEFLLEALGVGIPAFRIAGGILLLLLAIDMLFARPSGLRSTTPLEDAEAGQRQDLSVFPLAIPLIAGPGAMTSVVLLMGQADGSPARQAGVLAMLVLVLGATLIVLLLASRVARLLGVTGTNVVSRVLGIILAALACQFILDGIANSGLVT